MIHRGKEKTRFERALKADSDRLAKEERKAQAEEARLRRKIEAQRKLESAEQRRQLALQNRAHYVSVYSRTCPPESLYKTHNGTVVLRISVGPHQLFICFSDGLHKTLRHLLSEA